jgi:hypothetical protein
VEVKPGRLKAGLEHVKTEMPCLVACWTLMRTDEGYAPDAPAHHADIHHRYPDKFLWVKYEGGA